MGPALRQRGRRMAPHVLVMGARRIVREARQPAPGLLCCSNRGSQHASAASRPKLAAYGMLASMSGTGDRDVHTVAGRFFATMELAQVMTHDWHTREEVRRAIFR